MLVWWWRGQDVRRHIVSFLAATPKAQPEEEQPPRRVVYVTALSEEEAEERRAREAEPGSWSLSRQLLALSGISRDFAHDKQLMALRLMVGHSLPPSLTAAASSPRLTAFFGLPDADRACLPACLLCCGLRVVSDPRRLGWPRSRQAPAARVPALPLHRPLPAEGQPRGRGSHAGQPEVGRSVGRHPPGSAHPTDGFVGPYRQAQAEPRTDWRGLSLARSMVLVLLVRDRRLRRVIAVKKLLLLQTGVTEEVFGSDQVKEVGSR